MEVSIILFVFFIMVYITISDIITILFRLTGLTEENARFQVISLLTNSGFTTRESEVIVSSKIRRKLARATMLFGYAFTVTIVSTTVNFFMKLGKSQITYLFILIPLAGIFMISFHFLRKAPFIKRKFDRAIEKIGNRVIFGKNSNPILMLDDYGDMVLAQIYLQKVPSELKNVKLSDSPVFHKNNILVIMTKRQDGSSTQATANTVLNENDIIMVLGKRKSIREVFEKINN